MNQETTKNRKDLIKYQTIIEKIYTSSLNYEDLELNIFHEISEARILAFGIVEEMIWYYNTRSEKLNINNNLIQPYLKNYTSQNYIESLKTNFFTTLAGDEVIIIPAILDNCLDVKKMLIMGAGYNYYLKDENENIIEWLNNWEEKNNFHEFLEKAIDRKQIDGTLIIRIKNKIINNKNNYYLEIVDPLKIEIKNEDEFINSITIINKLGKIIYKDYIWENIILKEIYLFGQGLFYQFYNKKNENAKLLLVTEFEKELLLEKFNIKDYPTEKDLIFILKNKINNNYDNFGKSNITPVATMMLGLIEAYSQNQLAVRRMKPFLVVPESYKVKDSHGRPIDINQQFQLIQKKEIDINSPDYFEDDDQSKALKLQYANKVDFFQPTFDNKVYKDLIRMYSLAIASSFNIPAHYLDIDTVGITGEGILNEKERMNKIARQNEANAFAKFISKILNSILKLEYEIKLNNNKLYFEFNDVDEMTYREKLEIADKIKEVVSLREALNYLYDNDEEKIEEILKDNELELPLRNTLSDLNLNE